MKRIERLSQLPEAGVFDLAVMGGGATGLGVALDAALRGHRVIVLESHDFAGGTSSRSTKLLHGGVRYLAQGNVSLVREALHERSAILRVAPHVAAPLPFVMPAYRWWQAPFYGLGLKMYDALAGAAGLGPTRWLSKQDTRNSLPGVQASGLHAGVQYWDAQFDDARLAVAIARSAEAAGAWMFNHMAVTAITPGEGDRPWRLQTRDATSGQCHEVHARCVVNAAGVWVDGVRAMANPRAKVAPMVSPSQGVHLVVDRSFMAGDNALLVPKTKDGRVLFAVPWMGALILGTTDTPRQDAPREPQAFEDEVAFILREAAEVLSRAPTRADVRSIWVGLRPLVKPSGDQATQSISREHTIEVSPQGLVTVTGGKWTTYRAMAADVMAQIERAKLLPVRAAAATERHVLVGGGVPPSGPSAMTRAPGLHLYGDRAPEVLACPGADRDLGWGLSEAMVRHAVRHEYAWTVEDVLARRWRVLFVDARQALAMAPEVAAIIAQETGADPSLAAFETLCQQYVLSEASSARSAAAASTPAAREGAKAASAAH
jgi:glycerol-3-phosphate dehydrogenase